MASSVPNNEATQFKSGANAVENGRKGGIASGIAKREKKTMIETLKTMLDQTANVKGNDNNLTYRELITLGLFKGGMKGNANNYKVILEALGELSPDMQEAKEPTININISDNSNLAKEFKDEKDS